MFENLKECIFGTRDPGPMMVVMRHPLLDKPVRDMVKAIAKEQISRANLADKVESIYTSQLNLPEANEIRGVLEPQLAKPA